MIESNDTTLQENEIGKPLLKKKGKGMSTKTISSSNKMLSSSSNVLVPNLNSSFREKNSFDSLKSLELAENSSSLESSSPVHFYSVPSRPPMVQQASTESNSDVIHPLQSSDLDFTPSSLIVSNENNQTLQASQPDLLEFDTIQIIDENKDIFTISPSSSQVIEFDLTPTPISSSSIPSNLFADSKLFDFTPPNLLEDFAPAGSEAVIFSPGYLTSPQTETHEFMNELTSEDDIYTTNVEPDHYIEEPSHQVAYTNNNKNNNNHHHHNHNHDGSGFYHKYPMYHPDETTSQIIELNYENNVIPEEQSGSAQGYDSSYYEEQNVQYDNVYSQTTPTHNNTDYYPQDYNQQYYQENNQQNTNNNYPDYSPKNFESNPYYNEYTNNAPEPYTNYSNEVDQSYYYHNNDQVDPNHTSVTNNLSNEGAEYQNQEGYYDNAYYEEYPQAEYPTQTYDYSSQYPSNTYNEYSSSIMQESPSVLNQGDKAPDYDMLESLPEVQYTDDSSVDNRSSDSHQIELKSKIMGILTQRAGSDQTFARHMQVWERFIENASQYAQEKKSSFSTLSSTTSRLDVPTEDKINFSSGLALKFFAYTIDGQYSWPLLISSRRYLSLLALAKAGGESTDPILIHLALFAAVINADSNNVQHFLLKGGNANTVDEKGRSLAHHAARSGNGEILALLLDNNCDLDKLDDDKLAPIHVAIAYNKLRAIQFFIDSAVNINIKTSNELTLIGYAKKIQAIESEKLLSNLFNIPSESDEELFSPQMKQVKPDLSHINTKDISSPPKSQDRPHSSHVTFQSLEAENTPTADISSEVTLDSTLKKEISSTLESKKNSYSIYMDKVADDCWDFLVSLFTLAFSMILSKNILMKWFTFRPKTETNNANQLNNSNVSTKEDIWSQRSAPPTDSELNQYGLGYTNRSPSSKLQPPKDVQVAIAMSKAGIPLPSMSSPIIENKKSPSNRVKSPANKNNYSIGKNLPNGVSWRYVNILEDKLSEKSNSV